MAINPQPACAEYLGRAKPCIDTILNPHSTQLQRGWDLFAEVTVAPGLEPLSDSIARGLSAMLCYLYFFPAATSWLKK